MSLVTCDCHQMCVYTYPNSIHDEEVHLIYYLARTERRLADLNQVGTCIMPRHPVNLIDTTFVPRFWEIYAVSHDVAFLLFCHNESIYSNCTDGFSVYRSISITVKHSISIH
eukprot:592730_1